MVTPGAEPDKWRTGVDPDFGVKADTAVAGVVARPPALVLGALIAGLVLDRLLAWPPALPGDGMARAIIPGALIVIGAGMFAAGIGNFSMAATPVPTNRPVRALVTTGIHGWTRNPIYAGMLLVYLGIGMATRSAWILVLALPLIIAIRYGVIAREEAYLERRFGKAYREYKARVRRWL
jgi:protein-S-isoprenylcysteine O-methyltransferase Ste14